MSELAWFKLSERLVPRRDVSVVELGVDAVRRHWTGPGWADPTIRAVMVGAFNTLERTTAFLAN